MQSIRNRVAVFLALCTTLFVAACASDPKPEPPTSLKSITPVVETARQWSKKTDSVGRGRFEPYVDADQVVVATRDGAVSSFNPTDGSRQWRVDVKSSLGSGVGGDASKVYVSTTNGVIIALEADSGEELWRVNSSSEVLVPVISNFNTVVVRSADGRVLALEPDNGAERWSVSNTPPALTLNGYSKPLVVDGGVLVALDDGRLLALSLDTGREIWESVISIPSGRSEVERLVDIDADLLVDNAGIYVANYQGRLARLEPGRGQIQWAVPMSTTAGFTLFQNTLVVVTDNNSIRAIDKENGQDLWSTDVFEGRTLGTPAVTDTGDIVVGDVEGYLHVLSMSDGSVIGRSRVSDAAIRSRPQLLDSTLYVQTGDGVIAALRILR